MQSLDLLPKKEPLIKVGLILPEDKTENLIMNNLNQEFKNKTFIMIAHRKSTIEKCDKVWKLSNGKLTL